MIKRFIRKDKKNWFVWLKVFKNDLWDVVKYGIPLFVGSLAYGTLFRVCKPWIWKYLFYTHYDRTFPIIIGTIILTAFLTTCFYSYKRYLIELSMKEINNTESEE